MSTSVLTKEFERLAERNAQLLYTDEGKGETIVESKEKSDEFEGNLARLNEIKNLLEKADEFDAIKRGPRPRSARPRRSPKTPSSRPPARRRSSAGTPARSS
jgi:hypothetical protein